MTPQIYETFSQHLAQRLNRAVFTTEDSMRYSFFAATLEHTDLVPCDIVLEYPHNAIAGAEIDTVIPNYDGQTVVIEFKYDRVAPAGHNAPRPQKAGRLFNDIRRLITFNRQNQQALRLFVYLTDQEMAMYMQRPTNNLAEFFNLPPDQQFVVHNDFLDNKCATFRRAAGQPFNATVICRHSTALPNQHALRVYQVT